MRSPNRPWLWPVAAMLVLALVGCSMKSGAPPRVEGRALTPEERSVLDRAEAELTAECMRRTGFEFFAATPPAPAREFPYGIDDRNWAKVHGFGLAESKVASDRLIATDPNRRHFFSLSSKRRDEYLLALDGGRRDPVTVRLPDGSVLSASTRGCTAEAESRLYGDFSRWFRTEAQIERFPAEYRALVRKDAAYLAAVGAWAACIHDKGYGAANPDQLRTLVLEPLGEGWRVEDEIPAAVAEAECSDATRLVEIAEQVERAQAEKVYAAHREVIAEYQELSVAALGRVRAGLGTAR